MRTLVNLHPGAEFRAIEEVFDRLVGASQRPSNGQGIPAGTLPVDITEREGKLLVRAAVPGIAPEELEIQIEKNVLTIRGEAKYEATTEDEKVYRREVNYGKFARSIRLPEGLNLDATDAEFKNGVVTISIPRLPEEKPKSVKVNVRNTESPVLSEPVA